MCATGDCVNWYKINTTTEILYYCVKTDECNKSPTMLAKSIACTTSSSCRHTFCLSMHKFNRDQSEKKKLQRQEVRNRDGDLQYWSIQGKMIDLCILNLWFWISFFKFSQSHLLSLVKFTSPPPVNYRVYTRTCMQTCMDNYFRKP